MYETKQAHKDLWAQDLKNATTLEQSDLTEIQQ